MNIKTAVYHAFDGTPVPIEYDADAPCWCCGLPVGEASMGGTVICPACDCGQHRNGKPWTFKEANEFGKKFRENQAAAEEAKRVKNT